VRRLHGDAELRQTMGRQARTLVLESFSASRLKGIMDIYREQNDQ
jgi:hypothetical protein